MDGLRFSARYLSIYGDVHLLPQGAFQKTIQSVPLVFLWACLGKARDRGPIDSCGVHGNRVPKICPASNPGLQL